MTFWNKIKKSDMSLRLPQTYQLSTHMNNLDKETYKKKHYIL